MRVRLSLGRSAFFVAALLLCLVALVPLRSALDGFALGERGLSAREAKGTIWLGALAEARLGSMRLGDTTVRLRMLPLLLGRARFQLERPDEANPLALGLSIERHGFGVHDADGRIAGDPDAMPLPILAFDLTEVSVQFRGGLCTFAEGLVQARLGGDVAGIALPQLLSGTVRCSEGALLLPLVSQSGMERIDLRVAGDGRYRASVSIRPLDDETRARLMTPPFRRSGSGYVMDVSGTL